MELLVFLSAALLSLVLVPPLIKLAHRYHFIDAPDIRKVHAAPIPRIGGLAMVAGTILPLLVWLPFDSQLVPYLCGVSVIAVFGLWDDRADLDYRLKFLGQFVAAAIPVFVSGLVIRVIPFGPVDGLPDVIAYPLTIFFLVGITNAVNLSDGLDGLAGGTALLSLIVIALLASMADGTQLLIIALAVSGAIVGFLRYNTHPASIFMGDTGSQFLGFSLGVLTVMLVQSVNQALSPMLMVLLLGLPILDTVTVMFQRLREGRSLFSADKNHLHHKLLSSGLHHYEAVTAIYFLQSLFLAVALLLHYEADELLLVVYLSICFAVFLIINFVKRVRMRAGSVDVHSSVFAGLILSVRRHGLFIEGPLKFLKYIIPAYLLIGSLAIDSVPKDFGVLAAMFFVLLLIRLMMGYRAWFIYLRFMIFVAVAFVVYLLEVSLDARVDVPQWLDYPFFGVIGLALILAIRYKMASKFQVTPSDFLLILAMLVIGVIPADIRETYHLVPVAVKLVILLYGSELILKAMSSRWSLLPLSALAAMGVLAVRGFVL